MTATPPPRGTPNPDPAPATRATGRPLDPMSDGNTRLTDERRDAITRLGMAFSTTSTGTHAIFDLLYEIDHLRADLAEMRQAAVTADECRRAEASEVARLLAEAEAVEKCCELGLVARVEKGWCVTMSIPIGNGMAQMRYFENENIAAACLSALSAKESAS